MEEQDVVRELEELKFLVGTACSRAINLLMQPAPDCEVLREEMAFLGTKATRLAQLLALEGESPADNSK